MISVVRFNCLTTLLYQDVKCGLEDIALVEIKFVVTRVSTLHA
jgi:hypothetical protein